MKHDSVIGVSDADIKPLESEIEANVKKMKGEKNMISQKSKEKKSIYERWFGIKTAIRAGYPYSTAYGNAILSPEVIEAMNEAAMECVNMHELLRESGKVIAEICGAEAAFITSGDCAALTLATAAMMTGTEMAYMEQLPNTEYPYKLKNEVIIQRGHQTNYVCCLTNSGAKLVTVGGDYPPIPLGSKPKMIRGILYPAQQDRPDHVTYYGVQPWFPTVFDKEENRYTIKGFKIVPEDIEAAITARTAGIVALVDCSQSMPSPYTLSVEEIVKIGRKHNIPVLVDAPHIPEEGGEPGRRFLRKYIEMGADLVTCSGGKSIEAPSDTGFVYGKKELVDAVALNSIPHFRRVIGEGLKVSKEQIVGLVAAIKRYINLDHKAVLARNAKMAHWIAEQFKGLPHVTTEVYERKGFPHESVFEGGISVVFTIDERALGITIQKLADILWEGDPIINFVTTLEPWHKFQIYTHGLRDGDEKIVVERLKQALTLRKTHTPG